MPLVRFVLVAAAALLITACSPGGAVAPGTTRLEIALTDAMRIEPGSIQVPVGVPVTFVVTNDGVIEHEFYLGDAAAQAKHEAEMASGAMGHDEPGGITLKPGETKELTYTFATAEATLAGCHIPGHYAAGMKADITVSP